MSDTDTKPPAKNATVKVPPVAPLGYLVEPDGTSVVALVTRHHPPFSGVVNEKAVDSPEKVDLATFPSGRHGGEVRLGVRIAGGDGVTPHEALYHPIDRVDRPEPATESGVGA